MIWEWRGWDEDGLRFVVLSCWDVVIVCGLSDELFFDIGES